MFAGKCCGFCYEFTAYGVLYSTAYRSSQSMETCAGFFLNKEKFFISFLVTNKQFILDKKRPMGSLGILYFYLFYDY